MLKRILQQRDPSPPQRIRAVLSSLSVYDLHKRLVNDYILCRQGATTLLGRDTSRDKRDIDVIRENHKFLWDEGDTPDSWEARLAKKYYDKLFKEYCICDLSRYKENKIAMRWRTEQEVVIGKGQFSCGDKRCEETESLRTWEVNFAYKEQDEKKNALVKLRLCPDCSHKLNYHHKKREIIRNKTKKKQNLTDPSSSKRKKGDTEDSSKSSHEEQEDAADKGTTSESDDTDVPVDDEGMLWRGKHAAEEKSREDEFEEFLEDLLL
ncbi:protein FRA10AC1 homolog isoform X2 [Periplaneta americana]|uniref:protein FRA10AC1 homolog isoform X2 n=1 Tax=Periplaneta americana TaxID=6978 RepID=UPI0037E79124